VIKILRQGAENIADTHSKDHTKAQSDNNQEEESKALTAEVVTPENRNSIADKFFADKEIKGK